MLKLTIYDTLTKTIKNLNIKTKNIFKFYCCGPTVYDFAHIGNFRTFIIQDILRRILIVNNIKHLHVRNITDIDDKIIEKSHSEGMSRKKFTKFWINEFKKDCKYLNIISPHHQPLATNYIKEQIILIKDLIKNNYAYIEKDGSVYFNIKKFKTYGQLSNLQVKNIKNNNFVLWKKYKKSDQMNFWNSPWGIGKPGWHIECSAMCKSLIGETCDLHSGGIDLSFPHHENEIAQSESINKKPLALHWLHCAHLTINGNKMSKSIGNIITIRDIEKKGYNYNILRYALISTHYRKILNFTDNSLEISQKALNKIYKLIEFLNKNINNSDYINNYSFKYKNYILLKKIFLSLYNDLNIPKAIGDLFIFYNNIIYQPLSSKYAKLSLKYIKKILYILGLENIKIYDPNNNNNIIPISIKNLAQKRWEEKLKQNFKVADMLRHNIEKKGWIIIDKKHTFKIQKK